MAMRAPDTDLPIVFEDQVKGVIELGYLQTKKRPDEVRTEASLQGMTQIEAYDGKDGWRVSPFFGRKDPERMSADDVKALVEDPANLLLTS